MIEAVIKRALRLSPQLPRRIETGVGFAMGNWLENYVDGLHHTVMTCTDNAVMGRAERLESEVRFAHSSLQSLLQQGSGDWRPAVRVIADIIDDQVEVVTSHLLNVAIWGKGRAHEIELHAEREARKGLCILCRIDPEWARKRDEFLKKHGY